MTETLINHPTDSALTIQVPELWTTQEVTEHRTTEAMAIDPTSKDRVLFCPECGWNWPWGEDYGIMSATSRFHMHKHSERANGCLSHQAYAVTRQQMQTYWDQADHLED